MDGGAEVGTTGVSEAWLAAFQQAESMLGPDATMLQKLELTRNIQLSMRRLLSETEEFLADRGLTWAQVNAMCQDVAMDEPEADLEATHIGVWADRAQKAVLKLYFHGLTPDHIAKVLDLDLGSVLAFLDSMERRVGMRPADPEVLRLHFRERLPIIDIVARTGVPRRTVQTMIERTGSKPITSKPRIDPKTKAEAILLRKKGASKSEIARATGLKESQVTEIVRGAARRGEIPEYGQHRLSA